MIPSSEKVSNCRHILSLSTEEKCKFLESFDHIFSDIDGVLWMVQHGIEGASDGFKLLTSVGKKLTFLTNNSVRPAESYVERFQNINMEIDMNEIIHPAKNIVEYLKGIKFDGLIYVIASETFKGVLRKAGYKLIDGPNKIIDESFDVLVSHIFDDQPVRAVIIDVDFNLSSIKLIRAQLYLRNPDCLLIAGATDMLLPVSKDVNIIGPGAFARIIAESSQREIIALGKPGKELGEMILKRFDIIDKKRVLMIGDMIDQDIGFGLKCGFQTLLVLSGGCKEEELARAQLKPDYFAESMADFVQFMRDIEGFREQNNQAATS